MLNRILKAKTSRSAKSSTAIRQSGWERTDQRHTRTRRNLWGLMLFLLISIDAYGFREFNLFESASEPIRQLLGYPPPAYLISIALVVYCLSSAILTITSMANDVKPTSNWKHLGYRCAFYLFYCFSGAISAHFIPVLLIGLFLYSLDQCHIWLYNSKTLQQHNELLGKF